MASISFANIVFVSFCNLLLWNQDSTVYIMQGSLFQAPTTVAHSAQLTSPNCSSSSEFQSLPQSSIKQYDHVLHGSNPIFGTNSDIGKERIILAYSFRRVHNGRGGMAAGVQSKELRYHIFSHTEKAEERGRS